MIFLKALSWGLTAAFLRLAWHHIRSARHRRMRFTSAVQAAPIRMEGPAPVPLEEATRQPAHYRADIRRIAHSHDIHSN